MVLKNKKTGIDSHIPSWWNEENITALLLEARDGGPLKQIMDRADIRITVQAFGSFIIKHKDCPPRECPKGRFVQEFQRVRGPYRPQTIIDAEAVLERALDALAHHCECGGRKDDPDMLACYNCLDLDSRGSIKGDVRDRNLHESLMQKVIAGQHQLYPKLIA